MNTGRPKPPNAGKGRPKGAKNKTTRAFKEAVLRAFTGIGGDKTFQAWATQNQTEFYKIAARLIPTEVVGDPEQPVGVKVMFGGRYRAGDQ
jgi:hypothetical protein